MSDRVALLPRGINLGARNRLSMPALRDLLGAHGVAGVQTYVASGNVVVDRGDEEPGALRDRVRALVAEHLGLDVLWVVRGREEVDATVAADPLGVLPDVAGSPARHSVLFLDGDPDPDAVAALDPDAYLPEQVAVVGRDVHSWHPEGLRVSRLDPFVRALGVDGTARNWRTVLRLQQMLGGG
ncbi:DUF1697 domain-containing protein [Aquipuribacter hungaricus]|uniref:DUF1697 domain-containing protein n=1 Tax=Aquipuribacter hungaricus TaxID=545624 RepID=A0ABV7WHW4_9MICO